MTSLHIVVRYFWIRKALDFLIVATNRCYQPLCQRNQLPVKFCIDRQYDSVCIPPYFSLVLYNQDFMEEKGRRKVMNL